MAPILFLIFALVVGSFGNGQAESSNLDCQPKFRKWEVTCTEDRKHCYDANVQPKMMSASKPTKRFGVKKEENATCKLNVEEKGRKNATAQLENGIFFEDFSFESWINSTACCKNFGCLTTPDTPKSNEPIDISEFDPLTLLTFRGELPHNEPDGWKLQLKLNPGLIACDPNEQINGGIFPRKKPKKVLAYTCNEDGSDCKEEWVEKFDEFEENDKYNPLPIECQSMTDEDPKVKSGLYVICYESKLDPNNSFVEPKFAQLQNFNGSSLAIFCQKNATTPEKIWHGIAIKFWVTLSDLDLLVDMQIHFSYINKTFILPQIKKKHDIALMIYEFIFNVRTKILDPDGKIHDDYPTADLINSKENSFHKKAGLWLTFLDMPSNISSIMMFSKDDCHKFNGFLNANLALKTAKCHAVKDKIDKEDKEREEEQKKVDAIMEQVRELYKNCELPVDPNIPTDRIPPPELINSTRPPYEKHEGDDIIYTMEQAQELLKQARQKCDNGNNVRRIRKRQIAEHMFAHYDDTDKDNTFSWSGYRWDSKNPIPYTFEMENSGWQTNIKEGIRLIESRTCLRFQHDPNIQEKSTSSYIFFVDSVGCLSGLGRVDGKNVVKLLANGCHQPGTVAHEIIHRLGLTHEHKRNDQENFVWINLPEIKKGWAYAFLKSDSSKNLNMPYDFGSIMHYAPYDFQARNAYTIIAKERAYQQTMGQNDKPSFKDIKVLNRIYCDDICSKNLTCANGGYIDPLNCSKCICPDGFQGTKCDRFFFGDPLCHSGRRTAYTTEDYIETSDRINGSRECFWSIKTNYVNQRIEIRVHQLDNFECHDPCKESNYLEIQMTKDKTARGARLCCPSTLPFRFTLEYGVDALIKMKRTEDYHQFQLTYATPDAVEPDEPRKTTAACACDRMFNPWHTPGAKVIYDYIGTKMYYSVGIKSRSNLIINGKYPFKTQNGNVWFDRKCVYNDNDAIKRAYGEWIEPINKTNIAIDSIVAEECQTDYERSGCGEMNRIWQEFVKCLRDGNENKDISVAEEIAKKCLQGNENFRLSVCGNGYDPNAPKVENGIQ